ncbi:MAG: hypothetical protein A2152_01020 [Candidatus Levybacteria bacterium RBG_16_35_6]|nr:MAG: hypothetical protein A2152_01020 [Candidatus Levybacteria bacterium RBG_16_35_6]
MSLECVERVTKSGHVYVSHREGDRFTKKPSSAISSVETTDPRIVARAGKTYVVEEMLDLAKERELNGRTGDLSLIPTTEGRFIGDDLCLYATEVESIAASALYHVRLHSELETKKD